MTNRAILESLFARVLEGTGPDRELDAEIALALFGGEIVWKTARYTMDTYPTRRVQNSAYVGGYQNAGVLAYTESLDAAMTLVPEGWLYEIYSGKGEDWAEGKLTPNRAGPCFEACAATPARALIAACIKARMEALGE